VTGRVPSQPIQSYDLFEVEPWTIGNLLPSTVQPGESFRPLYEQAIAPVRDLVEIHEGNIATTWRPGGPIELLFIDLAKCPEVNDFLVQTLFPCLIPGTSILIQQDYLYADWNAWIHISMESLDPYFDQLTDTGSGSVVYALRQAIPPEAIAAATVTAMAAEAKQAAMSRARARWGGRQREMLRRSHARYLCGPVWFTGLDRDGHERVLRREIELDLDRLRTHARGRAAAIREVDALAERLAATPFEQPGRPVCCPARSVGGSARGASGCGRHSGGLREFRQREHQVIERTGRDDGRCRPVLRVALIDPAALERRITIVA
jgi:hypothetical protein